MKKKLLFVTLFLASFNLMGCTELGSQNNHEGEHLEHVYEAAESHVTFPYHLPHFEDYTIVSMYYVPHDEDFDTEEELHITYNADVFVTEEMEEAMENLKEVEIVESGGYSIYGPYYKSGETIQPINLIIKRSPFDVVSPDKDRDELYTVEIVGKEVVYDYTFDAMTGDGRFAYFIFEVENDGTYYRVYVEITSKMTEEEIEEKIEEMSDAILT
ncbi:MULTISPECIES: hypothetical protein [Bacillaceae]|uniref:Lipoprotein n=1 Tax=Evansella alkalicola TaxID=745819 RepID=A0ABS6JMU7_9BACI|nr:MULTISPECIES: hypothetical protein [Bacillaceae]MBU9719882.1 hypothetical protein [Bacillus alkalicola]